MTPRARLLSRICGRCSVPKPNRDQVKVSHYISRAGEQAVRDRAKAAGQTLADTYRELLKIGLQHAPKVAPPRQITTRQESF